MTAEATVVGRYISDKDAQAVSEILKDEMRKGRLDTVECRKALIERSRPKDSPTHHLFEWNPQKQSELYLLERAGHIIRCVQVVFLDRPEAPVRAFPTIVVKGKKGPYPIQKVLKQQHLIGALLEQAKADAQTWIRRYEALRGVAELRDIFDAIDKLNK